MFYQGRSFAQSVVSIIIIPKADSNTITGSLVSMVSNNTNTVADQARKAAKIKTLDQALESFLLVSLVFLFLVSFLKSIFQRLQGLEVRFYHQGHDVRYSTRLFRAWVLAFSSFPTAA